MEWTARGKQLVAETDASMFVVRPRRDGRWEAEEWPRPRPLHIPTPSGQMRNATLDDAASAQRRAERWAADAPVTD